MAAAGWWLDSWILIGLGVLTFLTAGASRVLARGAAELRREVDLRAGLSTTIPDRLIPRAMTIVNLHVFATPGARPTPDRYANAITNTWGLVGHVPPSIGTTLALLGVYLLSVGLTFVAFMVFATTI